jgi:hypothetical protein
MRDRASFLGIRHEPDYVLATEPVTRRVRRPRRLVRSLRGGCCGFLFSGEEESYNPNRQQEPAGNNCSRFMVLSQRFET